MPQHTKSRADLYREKAEESRAIAEGLRNADARATVLDVAAAWDRLAVVAERKEKLSVPLTANPD